MPRYFVSLARAGVFTADVEGSDLSEDMLESRVLEPYRKGGPVTLGGVTVDAAEVTRWRIWSAHQSRTSLLDRWPEPSADRDPAGNLAYLAARGGSVAPLMEQMVLRGDARDETDSWITGSPAVRAPTSLPPDEAPTELPETTSDPDRARRVMMVHGRDEEANEQLRSLLERLGLEVRNWEELVQAEGDAAPYIGDVVKQAFVDAQATVVLMTPDEHVRLDGRLADETTDEGRQARPNVYLEAGMALATHPGRTVPVEVGALRPVTDLAGRHTIRLDGTPEKLAVIGKRLATAGCIVQTPANDNWKNPAAYPALNPNRRA